MKSAFTVKCNILRRTHRPEQTPFTGVMLSGTHFTAEWTEAMRIKCLAQGHNILMLPGFEPSIDVLENQLLIHATNIPQLCMGWQVKDALPNSLNLHSDVLSKGMMLATAAASLARYPNKYIYTYKYTYI